ncbi:MAG: transglutaminase family protein [Verrucomicrobiae bacterium]|nr:transglutaminase family protein [Verrucomicrobiae bacterium]
MNQFRIEHLTHYHYSGPVMESFAELRLAPLATPHQKLKQRILTIYPETQVNSYLDHYGNQVEFFSLASRHEEMKILSQCEVEIAAQPYHSEPLSIQSAQQLYQSLTPDYFDFLASTLLVPLGKPFERFISKWFPAPKPLGEALFDFTRFINEHFHYESGTTTVETPAIQIAKTKQGVCQDFAHFMLAVLRTAQIPTRYVSGYIESSSSANQPELVGAEASHAWVEVLMPDQTWRGYDPTNGIFTENRHIVLAIGRDYSDVPPFRGTYQGSQSLNLTVQVNVKRIN